MIISRTPLRMSIAGGGSDLSSFYRRFGGAVVSTAINKYVYVTVNPKFDNGIRIAYSKNEEVSSVADIEHRLIKATMQHLEIDGGLEITTIADIPSLGTGLGSSSSFTVGLIHSLSAFQGIYVPAEKLGSEACYVEIELCGEPIGKQDQYAAAYGGFNKIEFQPDESVIVTPIICERKTMATVEENILLLYTGITRRASTLLKDQSAEMRSNTAKQRTMRRIVDLARILCQELQENNNADAFGGVLHEGWMLKREMASGISNDKIDDWYQRARLAGAQGGKILGAGGGGFLMLYAPKERHDEICVALPELRRVPVGFESTGSQIIFYH